MLIAPKTDATPGLYVDTNEVVAVVPSHNGLCGTDPDCYRVFFRDGRDTTVSLEHGAAILAKLH
jgi:hypothetical protein